MMPSIKSKAKQTSSKFHFSAIGTEWLIELYGQELTEVERSALLKRIDAFDATYSRFRADSWVTQLSNRAGTYALPDDALPLLALYKSLYRSTAGRMTPLIGQTISDAGYDATYSLNPKKLHRPPLWDSIITYTESAITLTKPALLDFGAAGKGYLVDIISELLRDLGARSFVVNAGGDMYIQNTEEPVRVGLENPLDTKQAIGVAELRGGSLCGSAGNRRAWANFHHIIDPNDLQSPSHLLATWATAQSTLLADGITTALYFVDPEVLQKAYTFEYAIMYTDSSVKVSETFPAKFFIDEG